MSLGDFIAKVRNAAAWVEYIGTIFQRIAGALSNLPDPPKKAGEVERVPRWKREQEVNRQPEPQKQEVSDDNNS